MERQEGYYWVKMDGDFIIAEWAYKRWYIINYEMDYTDSCFDFINENRIKFPGELPD